MQHAALASMIASALVATTTAAFGSVLLVRGTVVEVSPLMLCAIAGLLVGVSLLVVLPQAIDSLGAQGWQTESALCVFILAPMVMFFIEHIIVADTRGGLVDGQLAHVHIQGGGPKGHQVYVINVSTLKERAKQEQPDQVGVSRLNSPLHAGLHAAKRLRERRGRPVGTGLAHLLPRVDNKQNRVLLAVLGLLLVLGHLGVLVLLVIVVAVQRVVHGPELTTPSRTSAEKLSNGGTWPLRAAAFTMREGQ